MLTGGASLSSEPALAPRATKDFVKLEAIGGAAIAAGAIAALLLANSPLAAAYVRLIDTPFVVQFGGFSQSLPLKDWVGKALMAAFFFVIGLKAKLEVRRGELSSPRKLALPIAAAVGGAIGAALAFLAAGAAAPVAQGLPIGMASDLGLVFFALTLVGDRLPESLRLFLLSVLIAGDVGAVALIAALYTHHIHSWPLVGAILTLAALIGASEWRQAPLLLRAAGFLALGAFTLQSGIDTSLAGLAAALTVPAGARRPHHEGALAHFMDGVHPYVALGVLPLFAFTVTGLTLDRGFLAALASPLALSVAASLVIGKPVGMLAGSWLMVRAGLARRPTGVSWLQLTAAALLCGIGFSMSFYIGLRAFPPPPSLEQTQLRAGVLAGSLVAGVAGTALLAAVTPRRPVFIEA
jgi:NhaA family Na+:H+ antiporter